MRNPRTLVIALILGWLILQNAYAETAVEKSLTAQLATAVVAFDYQDIPPEAVAKAEQLIADSIAVAVGAHHIELLNDLQAIFEVNGGTHLVLHSGASAKLLEAVYLNSMAANMLDFDDSHIETGHPGASIIQPTLVLAAHYGKTREELIEAIVAGYEFNIRWARSVFNYPAKLKGPWSSALLQSFGTVIAAGKLLDLDEETLRRTLYFAAANMPLPVYQKVGLLPGQTFSELKNNYGQASHGAVLAVLTASSGAMADDTVLDGDQGLWRMMAAQEFHPQYLLQDLGQRWEILGVQIKPYAACRWMHSSVDALVALKEQVKVEDIERVDVYTYQAAVQALSAREPADLLAMQFSIPHVFGLALAGESMIDMRESGIANQAALDISRRVHVHLDQRYEDLFKQDKLPSRVVITLIDGSQLEKEVLVPLGEEANPISESDHRLKIRTLIESSPYENVRSYAWKVIEEESK